MSLFEMPALKNMLPALESALNKTLSMDPAAPKKLHPLRGCILELNISSMNQSFFFAVEDERVLLLTSDAEPTVTLSGSAIALLRLALQKDKNALFKRKEISLSGDAVRAQQIQNFVRTITIDWEALLAEAVGDMPARLISSGLQNSYSWTKSLSVSLTQDLEEFVKYELKLLPSRAMGKKQFEAIDQLRLASDRLEAKFKKLLNSSGATRNESCQN